MTTAFEGGTPRLKTTPAPRGYVPASNPAAGTGPEWTTGTPTYAGTHGALTFEVRDRWAVITVPANLVAFHPRWNTHPDIKPWFDAGWRFFGQWYEHSYDNTRTFNLTWDKTTPPVNPYAPTRAGITELPESDLVLTAGVFE